ncbi:MAG: type II secretion system protein [Campylobacter sp.]|nr:type II secretion system protein [Campylobacter sp.]
MKKGFSLLIAVIFMVILAILGMLALNFSTQSVKQTTDIYLKEQAEILAINATQLAVLLMQEHNYSVNCLEQVNINYPDNTSPIFTAKVDIRYLNEDLISCGTILNNPSKNMGDSYADGNNTALLDVTVESTSAVATEPIKYFRRTIQRP